MEIPVEELEQNPEVVKMPMPKRPTETGEQNFAPTQEMKNPMDFGVPTGTLHVASTESIKETMKLSRDMEQDSDTYEPVRMKMPKKPTTFDPMQDPFALQEGVDPMQGGYFPDSPDMDSVKMREAIYYAAATGEDPYLFYKDIEAARKQYDYVAPYSPFKHLDMMNVDDILAEPPPAQLVGRKVPATDEAQPTGPNFFGPEAEDAEGDFFPSRPVVEEPGKKELSTVDTASINWKIGKLNNFIGISQARILKDEVLTQEETAKLQLARIRREELQKAIADQTDFGWQSAIQSLPMYVGAAVESVKKPIIGGFIYSGDTNSGLLYDDLTHTADENGNFIPEHIAKEVALDNYALFALLEVINVGLLGTAIATGGVGATAFATVRSVAFRALVKKIGQSAALRAVERGLASRVGVALTGYAGAVTAETVTESAQDQVSFLATETAKAMTKEETGAALEPQTFSEWVDYTIDSVAGNAKTMAWLSLLGGPAALKKAAQRTAPSEAGKAAGKIAAIPADPTSLVYQHNVDSFMSQSGEILQNAGTLDNVATHIKENSGKVEIPELLAQDVQKRISGEVLNQTIDNRDEVRDVFMATAYGEDFISGQEQASIVYLDKVRDASTVATPDRDFTVDQADASVVLIEAQANYSNMPMGIYTAYQTSGVVSNERQLKAEYTRSATIAQMGLAEDSPAHLKDRGFLGVVKIDFPNDTVRLIAALKQPDIKGMLKELEETFKRTLRTEERAQVEGYHNLAERIQNYVDTGKTEQDNVTIFEKAKRWLSHIYTAAQRSTLDVSPELAAQFDKIRNGTPELRASMRGTTRITAPVEGLMVREVQDMVRRIIKRWKNAPTVHVIDNIADLSPDSHAKALEVFGENAYRLRGFFVKHTSGKTAVYLVASNLKDYAAVKETLAHEIFGHYGIRTVFGKNPELQKFLHDLYLLRQDEVDSYVAANRPELDMKKSQDRLVGAEEYFSDAVITNSPEVPWIKEQLQKLLAVVQNALRAVGIDITFNEADLRRVISKARQNVTEGAPTVATTQEVGELRGSINKTFVHNKQVPVNRKTELTKDREDREATKDIKLSELESEEAAPDVKLEKAAKAANEAFKAGKEAGINLANITFEEVKARFDKKIVALKEKMEKFKEAVRNAKEAARLRKYAREELKHYVKYFKTVLKNAQSKNVYESIGEGNPNQAILDLLEPIDFTKPTAKNLLKLEKTRAFLENNPETVLPQYVRDTLSRLDKTPIRDMTMDEVRNLHTTIQHLDHLAKLKGFLSAQYAKRVWEEHKNKVISEFKKVGEIKSNEEKTWLSSVLGKANKNIWSPLKMAHLQYSVLVEKIAGIGELYDVFVRKINEGRIVKLEYIREAQEEYAEILTALHDRFSEYVGKDVRAWFQEPKRIEVEMIAHGGKTRQWLSRGEYLTLLRHLLNEDNRAALVYGGMVFPNWENSETVFTMRPEEIGRIIEAANPAEIYVYSGPQIQTLFAEQGSRLTQAFFEKNGYPLELVENYFPKDVAGIDVDESPTERLRGRLIRFGAPKGMTFERIGSKKALRIYPFEKVVSNSIEEAGTYIGMESPLAAAARLLYANEFIEHVVNAYGKPLYESLEKGLKDVAQVRVPLTSWDKLFGKARANLAAGMLGFKVSTALKQITGYILFAPYVEKTRMLNILNVVGRSKNMPDKLDRLSQIFHERTQGYSRDLVDALMKSEEAKKLYGGQKWFKGWIGKGSLAEFRRRASLLTQWTDRFTAKIGMAAAYETAYENIGLDNYWGRVVRQRLGLEESMRKIFSPEFSNKYMQETREKYAIKYAEWVLSSTQPVFNPLHRSEISRGSAWVRTLFMFSDQTNAMLNMLLESAYSGDNRRLATALTAVLTNVPIEVAINLAKRKWLAMGALGLFAAKESGDDEDLLKEFAKQVLLNLTQLAYGVSQVASMLLTQRPWESAVLKAFADIWTTAGSLIGAVFSEDADEEKMLLKLRRFGEAVTTFLGIPARPLEEDLEYIAMAIGAVVNALEDRTDTTLQNPTQESVVQPMPPKPLSEEELGKVQKEIEEYEKTLRTKRAQRRRPERPWER